MCSCVWVRASVCSCFSFLVKNKQINPKMISQMMGEERVHTIYCRLMRRRLNVANPRIYRVSAAYIHIREEVVDEYQTIT